jgi:hypothetical protein
VTTTGTTSYTKTIAATKAAFKVGVCVTALGKSDDTGAIAATAVAVSAKQNGTCTIAGARNG